MSDCKGRERELPIGYQFGDASRLNCYLRDNIASHRFPFTPHGIADCIDDAVGRAVYEDMDAQWNQREGGMHS